MAIIEEHYDHTNGWSNTKPGWYECSIHAKHYDRYVEVVGWLYDNIGKCERHCRWGVTETETISFKFRYEKDYILFTLRWS
jgi:hypothetical protein